MSIKRPGGSVATAQAREAAMLVLGDGEWCHGGDLARRVVGILGPNRHYRIDLRFVRTLLTLLANDGVLERKVVGQARPIALYRLARKDTPDDAGK